MALEEFIETKKLKEFEQGYINYGILSEALSNMFHLEREKAYSFNFIIKSPDETTNGCYNVFPSVSNDDFKAEYQNFLTLMQHELDRVDAAIEYYVKKLNADMIKAKINLIRKQSFRIHTFIPSLWEQFFPAQSNSTIEYTKWDSDDLSLDDIESKLKQIKSNVIPLNKFALSKLLEKKASLVEKSQYIHLLLEVETGAEISPPPSMFPVPGRHNMHKFPTLVSSSIGSIGEDQCLDRSIRERLSYCELLEKNRNFKLKNSLDKNINGSISSPIILKSSQSSILSTSTSSSTYSNDDIVKSVRFWSKTPSDISELLNELKDAKRTNSKACTKYKLASEAPY